MKKLTADEVRPGDVLVNEKETEVLYTVLDVAKSTATGRVFALVADTKLGGKDEPIVWHESDATPYTRGSEWAAKLEADAAEHVADAEADEDGKAE